eukprot:Skav232293  [mRNA]  locus=scaffold882:366385:367594:- [translate_table: standard]
MLHVASAFSGNVIASLDIEEVNGTSTAFLKTCLCSMTGTSRFRQRIFLQDGSELADEEELSLTPQTLQLVLLHFQEPSLVAEQRLLAACQQDEIALLETCLAEPQDPNIKFSDDGPWRGFCPIHIAAAQGNLGILKALLDAGADKDSAGGMLGPTPLLMAAVGGHTDVVDCLINHGADVNKAKAERLLGSSVTPLFEAVWCGHFDVVQRLVEAGADVRKAANGSDHTPLMMAALTGQMDVVGFLLESGSGMDLMDSVTICFCGIEACRRIGSAMDDATTFFCEAAGNARGNLQCLNVLPDAVADRNSADNDEVSPLFVAALNKATDGVTPLITAALTGQMEVVRLLLGSGAGMDLVSIMSCGLKCASV